MLLPFWFSQRIRPFKPDYLGTVRASPLTKHESDTVNSSKYLKNNTKNEFFTIQSRTQTVDKIELFWEAVWRLRLVKGDSGRVRKAAIVMSPVAGAL
jgi:hypothetical protein